MMIKELIEQIGRERLETILLHESRFSRDTVIMARALLAVLDAQPIIYEAEINGVMSSVTKSHYDDCKRFGVRVRELYAAPPAASAPDGWKMVPTRLLLRYYRQG